MRTILNCATGLAAGAAWQNRGVRRLVLLLPVAALLAFGSAGAESPSGSPGASATALAIKISVPGQPDTTTQSVTSPPAASPAVGGAFAYPANGSIVAAQSTTASASATVAKNAAAKAESDVTALSLFGGEITADGVVARASAGTGYSGAGGNFLGSQVANLLVSGQPVGAQQRVQLGAWGTLTVGAQGIDRSAPAGARGYRGDLTELDVRLTADHGGLPAGSEIEIGFVETAVQTAPPAPATTTAPETTTTATPAATTTAPAATGQEPPLGDRPQLRPKRTPKPALIGPLKLHPKLTAKHYVFPVYGPTGYIDSFGSARSDVSYHHGDDIFGQLGEPLVACADGTVFSVGWNKVGGNRLWIRDAAGNEFYYAHLSAFSTAAVNGAHIRAGEVVGFMGNTGDAEGTPVHLHFEVHPVSLLYLGYDGAVDPTPYLKAWSHEEDLPFPVGAGWAPVVPGRSTAPEPGAMLLGSRDISSADGLDPASLRRALRPPTQLLQTLLPSAVPPPTSDLGKNASPGA
jgi:murein DD-endopeptidase MepM/ murein hydrolase activator NlpD